jgi:chromate reductase, NAD(P)H dehydrogenase (quinone)
MRILAFAASLKETSLNRRLLRLAARLAAEGGASVDIADFADFVCPNYDADREAAEGVPAGAVRLGGFSARWMAFSCPHPSTTPAFREP